MASGGAYPPEKEGLVLLNFGIFKGFDLENVPEDYLIWLAKGTGFTKAHTTEMKFSIPTPVWIEARIILEGRGYKIIGERIEKE